MLNTQHLADDLSDRLLSIPATAGLPWPQPRELDDDERRGGQTSFNPPTLAYTPHYVM
jgi:hypothetical protein